MRIHCIAYHAAERSKQLILYLPNTQTTRRSEKSYFKRNNILRIYIIHQQFRWQTHGRTHSQSFMYVHVRTLFCTPLSLGSSTDGGKLIGSFTVYALIFSNTLCVPNIGCYGCPYVPCSLCDTSLQATLDTRMGSIGIEGKLALHLQISVNRVCICSYFWYVLFSFIFLVDRL